MPMLKHVLAGAVAVGLIVATPFAAVAQTSQTETAKPAKPAKAKSKTSGAGIKAMRERQKKCGAEWKDSKAAGTVAKGMKWPKYWSECNKRLKAQG